MFTVQTEAYQLEGILKEKEELCRKLQFQSAESEQDSVRQLNQNRKSEELLEQYRCEVQEFKLKHRKQRMKFENQLLHLIEQHKNLHSVFSPERLSDEITSAENRRSQLLAAGKCPLLTHAHKLLILYMHDFSVYVCQGLVVIRTQEQGRQVWECKHKASFY
ncbi:uncharacterized protein si:ch211-199g17.9 [Trematomus bernacchii]|uniref:uncharacterized protein si:ch211-199g17.9 n=1 Tax=Trematomus bernacchii TaxID=40690 RepID=UPI00146D7B98|nr:uncharacterized protein si:ch211-199g17.9 [Trematomus bernacchii]